MNKTSYEADRNRKTLRVERHFNSPLGTVWRAWTEPRLLDQWWAPEPWKAKTSSMDFREGGYWLYSMNGPDGEQHWSRSDYLAITSPVHFIAKDCFCDEQGVKNHEMPAMQWEVHFKEQDVRTQVLVSITFPTLEDMDKLVEMGFKEGFAMAHENLDTLLKQLNT